MLDSANSSISVMKGPSQSSSVCDLWMIIPIFYDPKNNHIFASAYFCDASDTCSDLYVILMIYVKIFRVIFFLQRSVIMLYLTTIF